METNAEFAAICRESNATIAVTLQVNFERISGGITILLPYATIEPIRKLLLQMFMGEKFGRDPVWETHLKGEIKRTEMKVVGILHEKLIPLSDVSKRSEKRSVGKECVSTCISRWAAEHSKKKKDKK